MSENRSEGAYHHGDLPATLMDLALVHIAREGTEKLSLRALAREAGVSPTAPYKHFIWARYSSIISTTLGLLRSSVTNETSGQGLTQMGLLQAH